MDGPESPTELGAGSWKYISQRTMNELGRDGTFDMSAGLAFRSALATFPILLVAVAALGMLGRGNRVIDLIDQTLRKLGNPEGATAAKTVFQALADAPAGYALSVGLVLML